MKRLLALLLLGFTAITASTPAAAADYDSFRTNDEENNIDVFKSASPSVVYITNSRMVRRSVFNLNPEEIPQGSGSGFV